MNVTITPFRPEHAEAFDALNRRWLVDHGLLEPADEPHLRNPQARILDAGGAIFVATSGDQVVGTCALVPEGDGVFELVKLAVDPAAQGRGLGRRLVEATLDHARLAGARRVVLLSNSSLEPAVRLYEHVGFRHAPLPPDNPYATADVYMVLDLDRAGGDLDAR